MRLHKDRKDSGEGGATQKKGRVILTLERKWKEKDEQKGWQAD